MPFSSGTFTFTSNTFAPSPTTATTISSTDATSTWSELATALSTCVLKDGSQTITANIPMNSFKLTGLAAGSANGNSVRFEQTLAGLSTTKGDSLVATAANTVARRAAGSDNTLYGFDSAQTNGTNNFAAGYGISIASATISTSLTASQTFLSGDVSLNNTANYFNVVNTGAIGASGQVWKITAVGALTDTAGAASCLWRIWDGTSTVYAETEVAVAGANFSSPVTIVAIVTLGAATTFYSSAKDRTSTSGTVLTTGNSGTANKATSIIAERLS